MCLAYQKKQFHTALTIQVDIFGLQEGRRGRMKWKVVIVPFHKNILIAITEINYIKHCTDRNYVHKDAYLGSD
jgi:hypothetical protein